MLQQIVRRVEEFAGAANAGRVMFYTMRRSRDSANEQLSRKNLRQSSFPIEHSHGIT
jgi:hypothetical protein